MDPEGQTIGRALGNLGYGGGNNLALTWLAADYVLLLNNDTVVPEGSLERLTAALAAAPDAWAATPRILYADEPGRIAIALAFNRAIKSGELKGPVVLGRDHHDVSGNDGVAKDRLYRRLFAIEDARGTRVLAHLGRDRRQRGRDSGRAHHRYPGLRQRGYRVREDACRLSRVR